MAVYRRHKCLLHPESDTATTDGKISYARVDADWRKRPEPGGDFESPAPRARLDRTQHPETSQGNIANSQGLKHVYLCRTLHNKLLLLKLRLHGHPDCIFARCYFRCKTQK